MKCSMCTNQKHLEPCHRCLDKSKIYCRVCMRKHFKKDHTGEPDQRAMTLGDVMVKKRQLRYRCNTCKTYSKSGGKCPECGEVMKRVGK